MSLVHHLDQLTDDIVAVKCTRCGTRYDRDDIPIVGDDTVGCLDCGIGGMIPSRASKVDERFPPLLASHYTPLPEAVMDHRVALGIGANETLVVWALERHRRAAGDEVFPSQERLAELTGLSVPTIKRSIAKLVKKELVASRSFYFKDSGRRAPNRYTLDPLWQKLEDLENATTDQTDPRTTDHRDPRWAESGATTDKADTSTATTDHPDPPSMDQISPSPGITVIQEVDVPKEVEAAMKEIRTPSGARPASPAHVERPAPPNDPGPNPFGPDPGSEPIIDGDATNDDADTDEYQQFVTWKQHHHANLNTLDAWKQWKAREAAAA